MPQAIVYCDRCGRIIPPGELDRGQGIVGGEVAVCAQCAVDLTPEQCAALEQRARGGAPAPAKPSAPARPAGPAQGGPPRGPGPRPVERPSVAMRRRRGSARAAGTAEGPAGPPAAASGHTGIVIAGVAAGALVGIAIAVLVAFKPDRAGTADSGGRVGPPPPPAPGRTDVAAPAEPPPPAFVTTETPAEKRLAEIKRDMADPSLAGYAEIRKALRGFPAAFPDAGTEAAEAKRLLPELESRYDGIARNAFDQAKRSAETLASGWRLAEATKALDEVGEKYGESEWFRKNGKADLEEAREEIAESARKRAEADLKRAERARGDGDLEGALAALRDREGFPETARERAAALFAKIEGEIAERRKAEEEKEKRKAAWREFLVRFHGAGKEGAAKAKALVEGERAEFAGLREAGIAERLRSLEACLREAALVEELAGVGLKASRRTVRLTWKGQPVAGKPVTVRGGVLKLKRSVGGEVAIPLAELATGDIIRAAGVTKAKTGSPVRAAAYLLVRGDLEGARKHARSVMGAKGTDLLDVIDAIAEATAPPPAPEEPAVAAAAPPPPPDPDIGREVIADDADRDAAKFDGPWSRSTSRPGYHGASYHANTAKTGSATFTPEVPSPGRYEVYLRWTADGNRASETPVTVSHAGGTTAETVSQNKDGSKWNLLGTYEFAAGRSGSVTISAEGANGYVIADAVRFVKTGAGTGVAAPTAGLVGWWKLDETAGDAVRDSSASGIDGKLKGMSLPDASKPGICGAALSFDGGDDGIGLGRPAAMKGLSRYTVAAWVRPDDTDTDGHGDAIAAYEGGSKGFQLVWNWEAGNGKFGLMTDDVKHVWTPADKPNGRWYHVAATFEGGTARVYVDGIEEGEGPAGFTPDHELQFGSFGGGRAFRGLIDEVRIYDRALAGAELAALSAGPLLAKLGRPEGGLVGWWKFDETRGAEVSDSSGRGLDGMLRGIPGGEARRVAGKTSARSLAFDGRKVYVDLARHMAALKGLTQGTVSVWFSRSATEDKGYALFSVSDEAGKDIYSIALWKDSVWIEAKEGDAQRLKLGVGRLAQDAWHHLAFTVGPAGNRLYLNGVEQRPRYEKGSASSTDFFDDVPKATAADIGRARGWDKQSWMAKWPGRIDEVRVYSRPLAPAEVKAIFKSAELASARRARPGTPAPGAPGRLVTYAPPTEWAGRKPGASDGNPYLVDGKPRWRLDQIWPDDPMKAENYRPLVWKELRSGERWGADEHDHGGQPGAVVRDSGVTIGVRTGWPGQAGKKLAALSFIAPARGEYGLKGAVTPGIFDANAPLGLRVLRVDRKSGAVSEVAALRLTSKASKPLEKISVRLEEGQELALVPSFPGRGLVAANYAFKGLAVSARLAEFRRGLSAEYFAGKDPKPENRKATRIDANIDLDWGDGSPGPAVPRDGFSARWTGELEVPADGTYEFHVRRDDGARLWVDGKLVIDAWSDTAGQNTGRTSLKGGWRPFKLEFKENGGGAVIRLSWKGPGGADGVIPSERFRTPAPGSAALAGADEALPRGPEKPLPGETGQPGEWAPGLVCEVFEGSSFKRRVAVRIDPKIDWDFAGLPPDLDLKRGSYAVRWTGFFLAPFDGEITFYVEDVTAKLDGKTLENNKKVYIYGGLHKLEATAKLTSTKGKARLKWKPWDGGPSEAIPATHLFHEVPELGSMGPFAKLVRGVNTEYFADMLLRRKAAGGRHWSTDINFGDKAPCVNRNVGQDRFSVKLTGYVLATKAGEYEFQFDADDGGRLYVGDDQKPLIDSWADRPKDPPKAKTTLGKGYHGITLAGYDKNGDAKLSLKWYRPGGRTNKGKPVYEAIPAELLFCPPPEVGGTAAASRKGLAPGVEGSMYGDEQLRGAPVLARVDPGLAFSWGDKAPGPKVPAKFSARWEGYLFVPGSGGYLFRARHNGGIELVVAGKKIISRSSTTTDRDVTTEAGRAMGLSKGATPFTLTFASGKGKAKLALEWAGPDFPFRQLDPGSLVHRGKLAFAKPFGEKPEAATAGAPGPTPGGAPEPPTPPKLPPLPPALSGKKPSEPLPEGNLVTNGGFEDVGGDRFATGWHKWIDGGAQASVRTDMADAHGGEKSLSAKAFADGVKAGAWSTLAKAMPPGKYEVRFWACAEAANARVGVTVAGRELDDAPVGEDWAQVRKPFELTEKQVRPSLRLYATTSKVKIWIDDVEVEAAK